MAEEAEPSSMSDEETKRAAQTGSWEKSEDLENRAVFDVNGTRIGRVTKCFVEGGQIAYCDVHLDRQVRRRHDLDEDIGWMHPSWVHDETDEGLRIDKSVNQVVNPQSASEGHGAPSGSEDFPRKTR